MNWDAMLNPEDANVKDCGAKRKPGKSAGLSKKSVTLTD
jgi:hypothetical protein